MTPKPPLASPIASVTAAGDTILLLSVILFASLLNVVAPKTSKTEISLCPPAQGEISKLGSFQKVEWDKVTADEGGA